LCDASEDKLDILMEELFATFDRDGSGEFQFEEFRDFYTKLLADDECLQKLREYAHYRFRNKLIEKRRNEIYEQRKQKAKRRRLLKEKEGHVSSCPPADSLLLFFLSPPLLSLVLCS
jgi:hypothetical protein